MPSHVGERLEVVGDVRDGSRYDRCVEECEKSDKEDREHY